LSHRARFRFVDVPVEEGRTRRAVEVAVMEVAERITIWERRLPQRIAAIVAVTVKRRERAMEEEEEDEDERGQLILNIKILFDRGGRSTVSGFGIGRPNRPSDRDDGSMHICGH
jgi:hypothetical protein